MVFTDPTPVEIVPEPAPIDTTGAAGGPAVTGPRIATPPIVITFPDGSTQTVTMPDVIPAQGTPTHLPDLGSTTDLNPSHNHWDAWFRYAYNGFNNTQPQPGATLDLAQVFQAFQVPLERIIQTIATQTNLLGDFIEQTNLSFLQSIILQNDNVFGLWVEVNKLRVNHGNHLIAIEKWALPSLQKQITDTRRFAFSLVSGAVQALKVWSTENIYIPLATAIVQERVQRQTAVKKITQTDMPALRGDLLRQLAPVAVASALALKIATANQTWIDDCGAPMCETVGPKSNFGKLLKALDLASMAALLAELAALDEKGVEELLRGLQHLAAGVIHEFDDLFVGGGSTLGETISGAGG